MENLKQSRTSEDKDGMNMISKLPDPILHSILSRLQSTEEVVRTSILSTRWRYLWTLVPSIDIDYSRRLNPHKEFKKNKFDKFVSHVLENNSLDLDSFRLRCGNYYNMSSVRQWIEAAARRNVKLLDLMFWVDDEYDNKLPDCVVTCGSLEVLNLSLFGCSLCLPSCRGFSVLRVLELNKVQLCNGDIVTDFLKSCPLLEELKLKNVVVSKSLFSVEFKSFNRNIQISCPKLVFLELESNIGHYKCIGLDSLKKAVIKPNGLPSELLGNTNTMRELFSGISHVESLSINPFIVLKCIDAASLPNLKTLELTTSIDDFPINELIQILKYYPRLEDLHLIIKDVFSYQRRNSFEFAHQKLDEVEARRILTRHLKRVEFLEFNGEQASLSMARSLLLYGDALEEMVFSWDNKDKYPRKSMETMKKMSKFQKASSTVKFVTLLKD